MVKVGEICRAAGEVAYKKWRTSRFHPGANALVKGTFYENPKFQWNQYPNILFLVLLDACKPNGAAVVLVCLCVCVRESMCGAYGFPLVWADGTVPPPLAIAAPGLPTP